MENRSIVENDISEMEKMIEEGKMKEMLCKIEEIANWKT